jgi:hypothetical protein
MTFGCFSILPSDRELAAALAQNDASLAAGTKFIYEAGPATGLVWIAATFGCILGGVIYRAAAVSKPPEQSHEPTTQ